MSLISSPSTPPLAVPIERSAAGKRTPLGGAAQRFAARSHGERQSLSSADAYAVARRHPPARAVSVTTGSVRASPVCDEPRRGDAGLCPKGAHASVSPVLHPPYWSPKWLCVVPSVRERAGLRSFKALWVQQMSVCLPPVLATNITVTAPCGRAEWSRPGHLLFTRRQTLI